MTEYKRLDEKAWLECGKNLLTEKGSERQEEFLSVCQAGKDDFLRYMDEHLLSCEGHIIDGVTVPFKHKFTEQEFLHIPRDTQQVIWSVFKDVPDEMMACCGFWGYMIISMIENDYIRPYYLASALNGVTKTGIYVIDAALKTDKKKKEDRKIKIDRCVRRILRSMCNPAPRGKRIVFNDFYLGKSYWRWCWAQKMSEFIELEFEKILEILDVDYYAAFSEKMHTGKSYISSEKYFWWAFIIFEGWRQEKNRKQTIKKNY